MNLMHDHAEGTGSPAETYYCISLAASYLSNNQSENCHFTINAPPQSSHVTQKKKKGKSCCKMDEVVT